MLFVDAKEEEAVSPEIAKRTAAKKFLKDNYEWNSEMASADNVNKRPLVRKPWGLNWLNLFKDRFLDALVNDSKGFNDVL